MSNCQTNNFKKRPSSRWWLKKVPIIRRIRIFLLPSRGFSYSRFSLFAVVTLRRRMKVREASKEPSVKIGDSGLTGKALVLEEDKVGYTCYAVFLDAGTNLDISSAFGKNFNHIYYCISGNVCFECDEGTNVTLTSDTLIALPGGIEAKMNTTTKTHLFITYVKESTEGAQPQKPFFCALDEIIRTERDIDWIRGRSRRFLRQSDGFNVSLHNTVAYEGTQK